MPRLLIPHGDTCIEAVVQQRNDDRYHLVLQTGPDQYPPEIHATFLLPADAYFDSNDEAPKIAFQDPYVAVLIHPLAMTLHQITNTSSSIWTAGEGWTVSLPMETDGLWPGWLLQRLPAPPTLQLPHVPPSEPIVSRWFSLQNVWEDTLPIRILDNEHPTISREEESLVWVDFPKKFGITYHATQQQHTLWIMEEEINQPITRPLYEQTRGRQTVSDLSMLWGDLDEPTESPQLTRQEALAQALKVNISSKPIKRSRPSLATPFIADTATEGLALAPLIHPRWAWTPKLRRTARRPAQQVWCLTGNQPGETLLALLIPHDNNKLFEIQYWMLPQEGITLSTAQEYHSNLVCKGAQPVEAVPGRTDLLVWTTDNQVVLYRSGLEALLPFQLEGELAGLSDAVDSRVTLTYANGKAVRASVAVTSFVPWHERLWKLLENATPLAWALRLDCVRLQNLLVTQNANVSSSAALQVILDVLLELDWQNGQLAPPSMQEESDDAWQILLASDFHREFSSKWEDSLYLGDPVSTAKPVASSWMRQLYLENHPILIQAWQSATHQGTLATFFDALHLLWQDAQLSTQQRPMEMLELLLKVIRTVLKLDSSNAAALAFSEQYMSYGGEMSAILPLSLEATRVVHGKFTNFEQWCVWFV